MTLIFKNSFSCLMLGFTMLTFSMPAASLPKKDKNYFCQTDCKQEFKYFRDYAREGSPLADLMLAIMYYRGKGTEVDIEKGNSRLRRAANANEPAALYQLGYFLMHGLYMEKDLQAALNWFKRAAKYNQVGAEKKVAEVEALLNIGVADDTQMAVTPQAFFAGIDDQALKVELQLAEVDLCLVAGNRKAAEVILLFRDKGMVDAQEMRTSAVEWDMSDWAKGMDIDYAYDKGVDMDWQCVSNNFITRLNAMIEQDSKINNEKQFREQFADMKLLDAPLARLFRADSEVKRRMPRTDDEPARSDKSVEVITVSADFSYNEVLRVAKDQTCNAKCPPPWHYVVAPLIVLSSEVKD